MLAQFIIKCLRDYSVCGIIIIEQINNMVKNEFLFSFFLKQKKQKMKINKDEKVKRKFPSS
jgi:hypothetical protein